MDKELKILLSKYSDMDSHDILLEHKLVEDLRLCSYDMMVIISEVEMKLNKKVDIDKLLDNMTVEGFIHSLYWDWRC